MYVWTFAALCLGACVPPHDYALVRRFQKQRVEFEALRVAACKLPIWQHINSGLSDPVLDETRRSSFLIRMRNIGVNDLVVQGKPPSCIVQFGVWSSGFAGTPAEYKNYRYTGALRPKDATAIVQSLDHSPSSDKIEILERPLGDGWWLEYAS